MSHRVTVDLSDIEGIPPEAMEKLNKIEYDKYRSRRAIWEPWQDAVLLRLWGKVAQKEIAGVVGRSVETCCNRYKELEA